MKLPDKWKTFFAANSNKAVPLLVAAGLLGMLLIALSEWLPAAPKTAMQDNSISTEYTAQTEQKLCGMIEQIDGAGKATVMITLESGEETVYACDNRVSGDTSEEQHVLLGGSSPGALVNTVLLPQVQGVAVICQGADDVKVCAQITELASVLLGVTTNRISIAKMRA